MKKHTILTLILATTLGFQLAHAKNPSVSDSIVAVVNDHVITASQLNAQVQILKNTIPSLVTINPTEIEQQALNNLINTELLLQAAKRNQITASDNEVQAEITNIARNQNQSVSQFLAQVVKEGLSEPIFRDRIREKILLEKMQKSVASNHPVSEAEVNDFIEQAQKSGQTIPLGNPSYRYQVQHILIKGDNEKTRQYIQTIQNELLNGKDFSTAAKQYSQDASASSGGHLGWITEGQTVPEFEATVKSLQPGETSKPIQSQFGWHIIHLIQIDKNDSPEERTRNAARQILSEQRTQAAMSQILGQLYQQSFIDIRTH